MYQSPEAAATADDFRNEILSFRAEVYDFFAGIAPRFSDAGIDAYDKAIREFDERLYFMSFGIKEDLSADSYEHLVKEINDRKEVILGHFDNKDTVKDTYSFENMIPRATNFIRAAMIGSRALTDEAKEELKRLDDLHR
jgi:hypothetical protein